MFDIDEFIITCESNVITKEEWYKNHTLESLVTLEAKVASKNSHENKQYDYNNFIQSTLMNSNSLIQAKNDIERLTKDHDDEGVLRETIKEEGTYMTDPRLRYARKVLGISTEKDKIKEKEEKM